jgi:hypothetical protein
MTMDAPAIMLQDQTQDSLEFSINLRLAQVATDVNHSTIKGVFMNLV